MLLLVLVLVLVLLLLLRISILCVNLFVVGVVDGLVQSFNYIKYCRSFFLSFIIRFVSISFMYNALFTLLFFIRCLFVVDRCFYLSLLLLRF